MERHTIAGTIGPTVIDVEDLSVRTGLAWACLVLSALVAGWYEVRFHIQLRRHPGGAARVAHGKVRERWAEAVMRRSGNEVLAVQTIRNSVMSATIIGSTAALALMGTASLAVSQLAPAIFAPHAMFVHPTPRNILFALLVCVLFAILMFAVMAMRFYNHTGYLLTSLTLFDQPSEKQRRAAQIYIVKAGTFHSMSMRALLWLTPIAGGLVSPYLLPLITIAMLRVMVWFDRTPEALGAE